ncbi:hypothetical protein ASC74_18575 [Pseudomonas sp. Root329]|uniref:hypothetical protein n=1 Tax=Pseudomonas sp. Root329 TaxID=1736515 RepID=UPI0006FD9733|nr:hypothetical protein [Pseudomonas sp. Root329]KQV21061.1 hypothetical protein ASC74_18575 [Pseudomonas sp. Root329]
MWDDKDLWESANKIGIICTVFGTILAVITLVYAGKIRNILKRKVRPPEIHLEVAQLVLKLRAGIKGWEELERLNKEDFHEEKEVRRQDVMVLMYQVKAHLQTVRPNLESLQKHAADKIVNAIVVKKTWLDQSNRSLSTKQAWEIHNELHGFIVLLEGLIKDREATGS